MQFRSINMYITFILTYTCNDKASLSMFAVEVVNFRTDLITWYDHSFTEDTVQKAKFI